MASIVDTASQSDREVKLHPLVLINISDHYTREKVKGGDKGRRVYGVLFGVQDGMVADVCESYEMVYTIDKATGKVDFDEKFLYSFKDKSLSSALFFGPPVKIILFSSFDLAETRTL